MSEHITHENIDSLARLTGMDPNEVKDELIALGHYHLLGDNKAPSAIKSLDQDLRFVTMRETTAYSSPTATTGTVLSSLPRIVHATADVICNGRRRVALKQGGADQWIRIVDLAPYVGTSKTLLGAVEAQEMSSSWLTRKTGPFPVWMVGIGVAGVVTAIVLLMRRNK